MKLTYYIKKISVGLLVVSVLTLSGCMKRNEQVNEVQVQTFDLGSRTYTAVGGKVLPYQLGGMMAVPKGEGKFPLVLIAHGSHDNENEENRFDTGFEYLMIALAQKGYIVISMDVSKAYIWKYGDGNDNEKVRVIAHEHVQALQAGNKGEEKNYPIDLEGKIDFENIGLIGHSRGAKTVFDIVNDQNKEGIKMTSVLSIAPAFNDIEKGWPDVNTAIIVPEYDGDVISLDGFEIYDRIKKTDHKSFVSLTLLEKANHNYFNRNITVNDTKQLGKGYEDQLTREEQEDFLSQFAVEFFDAAMKGRVEGTLYDTNLPSPKSLYNNYSVKTLLHTTSQLPIIDLSEYDTRQDAWFYANDEIFGFNAPILGTPEEGIKDLISATWNTTGTSMSFTPLEADFSHKNSLNIEIAQDPTHEFAIPEQTQAFTLRLIDKEGKIGSVELINEAALRYVKGELEFTEIEGKKYYFWNRYTPLTGMTVPLEAFGGVDLTQIEKIEFVFDQTPRGAIMIESINLQ